jgi:hypothetical protein
MFHGYCWAPGTHGLAPLWWGPPQDNRMQAPEVAENPVMFLDHC